MLFFGHMKKNKFVAALLVALLFAGCASLKNDGSKGVQDVEEPLWVVKGSGANETLNIKVFQGVGLADEYRNLSLLQAFSEKRAMEELSKVLEDYTASLMEGFMASETAMGRGASTDRYRINRAMNAVKSKTFDKAMVVERWRHPVSGKAYSLVRVSLNEFRKLVKKAKKLDKKFKAYVKNNAGDIHEKLRKR